MKGDEKAFEYFLEKDDYSDVVAKVIELNNSPALLAKLFCNPVKIKKSVDDTIKAHKINPSANSATTGNYANSATTGEHSIAAALGFYNKAKAGKNGVLLLTWWDGKRKRVTIGYVGENVKQDQWYSVNDKGEFVETVE